MKGKPPKEILERREQSRPKKKNTQKSESNWDWKTWAGLVLGVAGLILGALILLPQVSVSLDTPTDRGGSFSTPFIISNDSLLPLANVTVQSYIVRSVSVNQGATINAAGGDYIPPE